MTELFLRFANILISVLWVVIIARVLVSWIPIGPDSPLIPVVRVVYQISEPILGPIRRALPSMGMLDLSPMIAILLLWIVQTILARVVV